MCGFFLKPAHWFGSGCLPLPENLAEQLPPVLVPHRKPALPILYVARRKVAHRRADFFRRSCPECSNPHVVHAFSPETTLAVFAHAAAKGMSTQQSCWIPHHRSPVRTSHRPNFLAPQRALPTPSPTTLPAAPQFAQHLGHHLAGQGADSLRVPRAPVQALDLVRKNNPANSKPRRDFDLKGVALLLTRDWTQNRQPRPSPLYAAGDRTTAGAALPARARTGGPV